MCCFFLNDFFFVCCCFYNLIKEILRNSILSWIFYKYPSSDKQHSCCFIKVGRRSTTTWTYLSLRHVACRVFIKTPTKTPPWAAEKMMKVMLEAKFFSEALEPGRRIAVPFFTYQPPNHSGRPYSSSTAKIFPGGIYFFQKKPSSV